MMKMNAALTVKNWRARLLFLLMSAGYLAFLFDLLFIRNRGFLDGYKYNIIPFQTIGMYISQAHRFNFWIWSANLFGNIVLFIPLGFLIPACIRFARRPMLASVLLLLVNTSIEVAQIIWHVGSFDVDDIILNFFGGMLGIVLFGWLKRDVKMQKSQ
ncbi:VanZ family protein [Brevibacillus fluminis]|uniref:VanZ family protein n=1 Tax=Brevibacillus fluminis TaxID=511487 RepID=UPI003F88FCCF